MPQVLGAPEALNALLEEVYSSCMATKKDKGVCSATAWSAAEGAGWHKNKEGKWTKKSAEEIKRDDLIKKGGIKVKSNKNNTGEIICSNCGFEFDWVKQSEVKMGYVDCPECKFWVDQTGKAFKKTI